MRSTNLLSKETSPYVKTAIYLRSNIGTYPPPCYVCRISNTQRSILSIVSLVDYNNSKYKIIPHESVNEKKVNTYKNQFFEEFQLINPILLFYKNHPEFRLFLSNLVHNKTPEMKCFIKENTYEVWPICEFKILYEIQNYFHNIQNFYVADGHHRIEALTSLKDCGLYPFSGQYLSLILEEKDLGLTSFNRFIRDARFDNLDLLKKLSVLYNIKKVLPCSLMVQKNIYFYTGDDWHELEITESLHKKEQVFPAIFLDKFLVSELESEGTSGFDKFIYLPQTNRVNDIIDFYKSYNCQLAVSIPKALLADLYKFTEKGERLPPHSTYFTPKIPDNLFIQRLKP